MNPLRISKHRRREVDALLHGNPTVSALLNKVDEADHLYWKCSAQCAGHPECLFACEECRQAMLSNA